MRACVRASLCVLSAAGAMARGDAVCVRARARAHWRGGGEEVGCVCCERVRAWVLACERGADPREDDGGVRVGWVGLRG